TSVQCGAALGLGALAAIASAVTRSQEAGHTHAAALTNGYIAGLLAGAIIYAAGAGGAAVPLNARPRTRQRARHRALPEPAGRPAGRSAGRPAGRSEHP